MVAKLIRAIDPIEVKQIGVLLYGEPGGRKTSCAQTADRPFTFAFDPGIYRCYGRKDCAMFDSWQDVVDLTNGKGDGELVAALDAAKTIVLDTVGEGMVKAADAIMQESPKNGNRMGGLSLPGYGMLANRFGSWVQSVFARGKDIVMVAHEDSERRGEEDYYKPAFVGQKFYTTAMRYADMVGYLHFENGKRVVDFTPSDRFFAKVPPTGVGHVVLPDFGAEPEFLAKLIADAKASMGKISARSSEIAAIVDDWKKRLDPDTCNTEKLNAMFPEYESLKEPAKSQVRTLMFALTSQFGLVFDKDTKTFVEKGVA